ncbi:MAG TPA: hypothetical protein VJ836_06795 [Candidatus Saccharimonadales bacterium]|nr:hypothetical protein [Candidatus Saccharimonadales bacterium]
MEDQSPFTRSRELEISLVSLLASLDADWLSLPEREQVARLKHQATDIRLDIRDYGMAETLAEQQKLAREAHKRLEQLQQSIVKASEYGLFGAVDVAHLSATIQQIIADIKE